MPLLRIDLYEGRTDAELKVLLDAIHRSMLAAFGVPERDRYQIVHQHPVADMIMEDTGLGIPRTGKFVCIQVTTRPRTKEMKETHIDSTSFESRNLLTKGRASVRINSCKLRQLARGWTPLTAS